MQVLNKNSNKKNTSKFFYFKRNINFDEIINLINQPDKVREIHDNISVILLGLDIEEFNEIVERSAENDNCDFSVFYSRIKDVKDKNYKIKC